MSPMLQKGGSFQDSLKKPRLVNSLGATPLEELYILYRTVSKMLQSMGVAIGFQLIGRYATPMEMTGASLSLMKLYGELEELLKAPADCTFWKV